MVAPTLNAKLCGEIAASQGLIEDDLGAKLNSVGDACVYRIKSPGLISVKLHGLEPSTTCYSTDRAYIVADGIQYGPFCSNSGDYHQRSSRFLQPDDIANIAVVEWFGIHDVMTALSTNPSRKTTKQKRHINAPHNQPKKYKSVRAYHAKQYGLNQQKALYPEKHRNINPEHIPGRNPRRIQKGERPVRYQSTTNHATNQHKQHMKTNSKKQPNPPFSYQEASYKNPAWANWQTVELDLTQLRAGNQNHNKPAGKNPTGLPNKYQSNPIYPTTKTPQNHSLNNPGKTPSKNKLNPTSKSKTKSPIQYYPDPSKQLSIAEYSVQPTIEDYGILNQLNAQWANFQKPSNSLSHLVNWNQLKQLEQLQKQNQLHQLQQMQKLKQLQHLQQLQKLQELQALKALQELQELQQLQKLQDFQALHELQELQKLQELQNLHNYHEGPVMPYQQPKPTQHWMNRNRPTVASYSTTVETTLTTTTSTTSTMTTTTSTTSTTSTISSIYTTTATTTGFSAEDIDITMETTIDPTYTTMGETTNYETTLTTTSTSTTTTTEQPTTYKPFNSPKSTNPVNTYTINNPPHPYLSEEMINGPIIISDQDTEETFYAPEITIIYIKGSSDKIPTSFKFEWNVLKQTVSEESTKPSKAPYTELLTKPSSKLPTKPYTQPYQNPYANPYTSKTPAATTTTKVPETTNLSDNPQVIDDIPLHCPKNWPANNDKCELKYLKVCTSTKFRDLAATCTDKMLLYKYRYIVYKFSRLAVTGDGDRHCIYKTQQVNCNQMDFSSVDNLLELVAKLKVLSNVIFDMCGKSALRKKLTPIILNLKTLSEKCVGTDNTINSKPNQYNPEIEYTEKPITYPTTPSWRPTTRPPVNVPDKYSTNLPNYHPINPPTPNSNNQQNVYPTGKPAIYPSNAPQQHYQLPDVGYHTQKPGLYLTNTQDIPNYHSSYTPTQKYDNTQNVYQTGKPSLYLSNKQDYQLPEVSFYTEKPEIFSINPPDLPNYHYLNPPTPNYNSQEGYHTGKPAAYPSNSPEQQYELTQAEYHKDKPAIYSTNPTIATNNYLSNIPAKYEQISQDGFNTAKPVLYHPNPTDIYAEQLHSKPIQTDYPTNPIRPAVSDNVSPVWQNWQILTLTELDLSQLDPAFIGNQPQYDFDDKNPTDTPSKYSSTPPEQYHQLPDGGYNTEKPAIHPLNPHPTYLTESLNNYPSNPPSQYHEIPLVGYQTDKPPVNPSDPTVDYLTNPPESYTLSLPLRPTGGSAPYNKIPSKPESLKPTFLNWHNLPDVELDLNHAGIVDPLNKSPNYSIQHPFTVPTRYPIKTTPAKLIEAVPSSCPSNWPMEQKTCHLKYTKMCTTTPFRDVAYGCTDKLMFYKFRYIVYKFSRLSVTGDGDRRCIYPENEFYCQLMDFEAKNVRDFIAKLEVLINVVLNLCSNSELRKKVSPALADLKMLSQKCSTATTPTKTTTPSAYKTITTITHAYIHLAPTTTTTIPYKTTTSTTTSTTTTKNTLSKVDLDSIEMDKNGTLIDFINELPPSEQFCMLGMYHSASDTFKKASHTAINPAQAEDAFNALSKGITILQDTHSDACDGELLFNGLVPCNLLLLPTDELACQMSFRINRLFRHIKTVCGTKWSRYYMGFVMQLHRSVELCSIDNIENTTVAQLEEPRVLLKSTSTNCVLAKRLESHKNPVEHAMIRLSKTLSNQSANPKFTGTTKQRYYPLIQVRCN